MSNERRSFDRELVPIRFIYSTAGENAWSAGEWREAETIDIGPVLVGGLAFYTHEDFELNSPIRIALFMDLDLKRLWDRENEEFPVIYSGTIRRITPENGMKKVAVMFDGFDKDKKL